MEPKVELITWTKDPLKALAVIWEASRTEGELEGKFDMAEVSKIINSRLPITQNIHFTFLLSNVPISFREQMVRHKVGCRVGERIGMDTIPDLEDSAFWSQSIRYLQPRRFATDKKYREPHGRGEKEMSLYRGLMLEIERVYNLLLDAGWSQEDAREGLPVGMLHRITWTLSLATLQHVIGNRSCWLAQTDLWAPIIQGMVDEMCEKVDPFFRNMVAPPCIKGNCYTSCPFRIENDARVKGTDPLPPCPLFLEGKKPETPHKLFAAYEEKYKKLWGKTNLWSW